MYLSAAAADGTASPVLFPADNLPRYRVVRAPQSDKTYQNVLGIGCSLRYRAMSIHGGKLVDNDGNAVSKNVKKKCKYFRKLYDALLARCDGKSFCKWTEEEADQLRSSCPGASRISFDFDCDRKGRPAR